MRATSCIILHVHISLIHSYHCENLKKLFYNFSFEFFPTTYELPVGIFDFKCPFNKKNPQVLDLIDSDTKLHQVF